jgi:Mce-associated membrane protein
MAALLGAVVLSTPAAAAQRDDDDNIAVIDVAATADFLDRANSVIEEVFSYDYRTVDEHERSVAELTADEFQDDYLELFGQVVTQAPARQIVMTSTVAASAVQWLDEAEADALVFLDQKSSSAGQQEAAAGAAFLASFELVDDEWLLAGVTVMGAE